MKLSQRAESHTALICYSVAGEMFASWNNPSFRLTGYKDHTWEDFPGVVAKYCIMQVSLNVIVPDNQRKKLEEYTDTIAKKIAQRLVDELQREYDSN